MKRRATGDRDQLPRPKVITLSDDDTMESFPPNNEGGIPKKPTFSMSSGLAEALFSDGEDDIMKTYGYGEKRGARQSANILKTPTQTAAHALTPPETPVKLKRTHRLRDMPSEQTMLPEQFSFQDAKVTDVGKPPKDVKRSLLVTKPHAYSLGKLKIVHSKENDLGDDETATIIIRDLYEQTAYKAFGVTGKDVIKSVFYSILCLFNEKKGKLMEQAKYANVGHITKIAATMCEQGLFEQFSIESIKSEKRKVKMIYLRPDAEKTIGVGLTIQESYAQFFMSNITDGEMKSGVYLFTSEAISLLRHINTRFQFEPAQSRLSSISISDSFVNTDSDDFF